MCYNCFDNYYGDEESDKHPMLLESIAVQKLINNTDLGRINRGKLNIVKSEYCWHMVDGESKELEKIEYEYRSRPSTEEKDHQGYVIFEGIGKKAIIHELWCSCLDFGYRLYYPLVKKGLATFDLENKYKAIESKRGFGKHNELKSVDGKSAPTANPTGKIFLCKHLVHALFYLVLAKTKSEAKRPEAEVIRDVPVKIVKLGKKLPEPEEIKKVEEPEKKVEPVTKEVPLPKSKQKGYVRPSRADAQAEREARIQAAIDKKIEDDRAKKEKAAKETSKQDKEEGKAEREEKAIEDKIRKREEALKAAQAQKKEPVVQKPIEKPVVKAVKAPEVKNVAQTPPPVVKKVPEPVKSSPAPVKKVPVAPAPATKKPEVKKVAPVVKKPAPVQPVVKKIATPAPAVKKVVAPTPVVKAAPVTAPVAKTPVVKKPVVKAPPPVQPVAKPAPVQPAVKVPPKISDYKKQQDAIRAATEAKKVADQEAKKAKSFATAADEAKAKKQVAAPVVKPVPPKKETLSQFVDKNKKIEPPKK